ncbi:MAG: polyprenyl synthetase family protein [Christensenellaceae bacterium]|jgi:geranylgeranyl diphosphate synthase type II|nr:polyprenyl synthetase family protein [Christensenellaceae bacterium]
MADPIHAAKYREIIGGELTKYLQDPDIPKQLRAPMAYSLHTGGKLLRPSLALAVCDMLDGGFVAVLPVACAIEMIHTYSLIHDDLPAMDDDDYRRGKPSNHKVFGEGNAILAGDGLLTYAFEVMLRALALYTDCPGYLDAIRAVANGAGVRGMVGGQAMDLASDGGAAADAAQLEYIHTHKTGAMIKASVLAGAYIAGANAAQLKALDKFGTLYGLLFQITDDILDVEGSLQDMGKTSGKDKQANKLTYVNMYGLETAKQMARDTAARAKETVAMFGESAGYFIELTDSTLKRDR